MQFESFYWLSHHGALYMGHYTMIYKNCERMRDFFGPFCFYCSLVFYILGVFLIKQLYNSTRACSI